MLGPVLERTATGVARARRSAWVLAAALALVSATGRADDARDASRAAFRRGVEELKRGDYAKARASFLEAYDLYAHPSILLNLGVARSKTGEWVEAERDLGRFLVEDTGASQEEIQTARQVLADVRKHIGIVRVRVDPASATAKLDGRPIALVPGTFADVRVSEGAHVLAAQAPGFRPFEQRLFAQAERTVLAELRLEREAPVARANADDPKRTLAFVFAGLASVSLGVGIWSGLRAQSLADEYNTPGDPKFQDADTRSSGVASRTTADVAFVVALASAGAAAYFFLAPSGKNATSVRVGPGFAALRGAF